MIVPTFAECEWITRHGKLIGMGSARSVFTHEDFPGIVVKEERGSGEWDECQNLTEAENYRLLTEKGLPTYLAIPKTVLVGGVYIVQEHIKGVQPDYSHSFFMACNCPELFGLDFCWRREWYKYNDDPNPYNVLLVGKKAYLIDLGV